MTDSIHLLLGAYVLDALDPEQTAQFEAHLPECEECRREVAELRETAAALGMAQTGPDTSELNASVMAAITTTSQLTPDVIRPRRSRRASLSWFAAAAAVVVALVLAGGLRNQQQTITAMNDHTAEVMALVTAPDVKIVPLGLPGGNSTVAVSTARNEAMMLGDGLPEPSQGMVYQTWAYGPQGDPVAAGTWTPDASGHATAPVTADVARTLMLAVTLEPAGGSPQPTSQPLTMVEL